ncbi:MAG: NusG domain II-containing protein [Ruminiclostridium sp.]|nr:NusG domain II-containing protein [Ruminiclostridium sp.]
MDKQKTICILIIILIIFAAILGLFIVKGEKVLGGEACIYSDGKRIRTIKLSPDDDYTFEVKNKDGKVNTIIVKNGEIGVLSADCPDKICVNTPYISDGLQPVVCVPNHLVIQIEARRTQDND